jgi:hypothetical protein
VFLISRKVTLDPKIVPTPRANEVVVFEDLFTTGLRIPPHHGDFVKNPCSNASANVECYHTDQEIYLGN